MHPDANPQGPPEKLCVIGEADPFIARLLQRFAEQSGFRVKIAQTGEAVLSCAQQDHPTLVILEPELPGKLRGWEAARILGSGENAQSARVILCTWMPESDSLSLVGRELNHLQKPDLHYSDFLDALSAVGIH